VRDEHGIVNHFVGITEDITDRKRAEEILRATSALQRAILDSAGYAVISTSAEGHIRIFNAAAERMIGYKAAEVIGRPTSILIHDWTEVERRARELSVELGRPVSPDFEVFVAKARLGQADEHEWTYVRKDGTKLPVLLSVTPVRDERGVILGFMGIASDITERKRAETQLQQARQAAESASRAKGEFLANMSHEIRTPMNAVMGMTELALGTELSREQRGYLTAARNSAIDLLTIINDVLDFSKIEAGKLELHPEPFQLRDALGLDLKAFSLRAAEKGLELTLRVHPDVPDTLDGDVGRLRQIVNNLVSNALKFTEDGEVAVDVTLLKEVERQRELRVESRSRAPSTAVSQLSTQNPPNVLLHFRVSDTGIGVALDKQTAIFEAFTQADASVTRQYGGTGLGLTIAGRLCRLMGGEIWVESERGKGSTFHFTAAFECVAKEFRGHRVVGQLETQNSKLETLSGERVLVVDDNATNRRILCEMLANWRMVPQAAASVDEALAALRASSDGDAPFRCVLLDASMAGADRLSKVQAPGSEANPGSSAFDLGPSSPMIIMMLSSMNRSEEIRRCRAAGVEKFLIKPVAQSELLDALLRRDNGAGQPGRPAGRFTPAGLPTFPSAAVPLRVLLAEDNSVNRELASTVLQKLGHSVEAVWNGQEVLNSWKDGGFDIILMDVQMPIMDGLETTGRIRQQEDGTGSHIPIIGLTAHAMKGDREHGLAAGMDDYLTKPLQLEDLARAIEKVAPGETRAARERKTAFDPAQLLRSFGGDKAALRRLVGLFVESTPPIVESMRCAARNRDAPALHQAAHTLKGSLTLFEDAELRRAAAELERHARTGDTDKAVETASRLVRILEPFQESLQRWLKEEA
jgi:PAS domain S-box-containing protein